MSNDPGSLVTRQFGPRAAAYVASAVHATGEDLEELNRFAEKWGKPYTAITTLWQRNWERVIPFFVFPAEVRKIIYTTNTVEALNRSFRKIIKNRGAFPSEEAAIKLLYLAMRNAVARWNNSVQDWKVALNQFTLLWEDRIRAATRS